jgi:hypothetical protein
MTWAKFGVEFLGQLMMAGLSDAAARTHTEALLWLYEIEAGNLRIPRHLVRSIAASPDYEAGIKELVAAEFWRDDGDTYTVLHHADVYRQSLAAQLTHREKEKNRQRRKRSGIGPNVGTNVGARQTYRQTRDQDVVLDLSRGTDDGQIAVDAAKQDRPGAVGGGTTGLNGSGLATPPHSLHEHDGPESARTDVQHDSIEVHGQSQDSDRYARARPA